MPRGVRVTVYKDGDGRYRWRAVAGNNRITGASEQGYRSKRWAKHKARKQFPGAVFDG